MKLEDIPATDEYLRNFYKGGNPMFHRKKVNPLILRIDADREIIAELTQELIALKVPGQDS